LQEASAVVETLRSIGTSVKQTDGSLNTDALKMRMAE